MTLRDCGFWRGRMFLGGVCFFGGGGAVLESFAKDPGETNTKKYYRSG